MNRVLITIGPITIYWYSILILAAILIGYQIVTKYSKKINYHPSELIDMMFYLVIWAIIGARIYYVIFNLKAYQDDLLHIFFIWEGGLAIYGAIIASVIYIYYYCKKHKLNFIKVLDIFSLPLILGQSIGRWGNFFNSEAYGTTTTYIALKKKHIPEFIIKGMYIDGEYHIPTFLYESIWCLLGFLILCIIRKKYTNKTGLQLYFYLIWYGIGRFFIESLRTDSLYLGPFRISQIVSIIIIIIGIIGIISLKKEKNIE